MHRLYLLCPFVLLFSSVFAQNNLPSTYIFDEPPTAIFAQMIHNDTIICIGNVFKEGDTITYQQGAFIAFIDTCGNLIYYRKYFDPQGRDIFLNLSNKIIRTKDSGYCFVGSVGSQKLIIKTDRKGDLIFAREYPVPNDFEYATFASIHEVNNSLYVIGFGGTDMPLEDDLFMAKFDSDGTPLGYWRFLTPENCEYFQDATVKGSSIVISTSQTNACVSTFLKSKTRIFEVDTSGHILWDWVDNGNNLKRGAGMGLKSTPDGGWVYAGTYNDTMIGSWPYSRLFVTKIDSTKNHLWSQVIGYQDIYSYNSFRDIAIDTEGNYIVGGQYKTGYPDFPDQFPATAAIVTKISPDGEIIWTNIIKAYENGPDNGLVMFTQNINLLSSGNILLGGYLFRLLNIDLQNEGWLAKLSPNGEVLDDPDPLCGFVSTQQPQINPGFDISCYPNPVRDILSIHIADSQWDQLSWTLYDIYSKKVLQKTLTYTSTPIEIDVSFLPTGIYFWEATSKGKAIIRNRATLIKH